MRRWAVVALGWNLVTILLGALVRATHSGAGCGRSWPTCSGELVPALAGATAIEYLHRVASGIALALVFGLFVVVRRHAQSGAPVRHAATWALIAIGAEVLIGAAIVLYEWVGADDSVARIVAVPLHLANTLLLLGALTLVVWFASGGGRLDRRGQVRGWLIAGALGLVLIAATGAVTALADTLFPKDGSGSLGASNILTDLRAVHPFLAVALVVLAAFATRRAETRTLWPMLAWLILGQLALGVANVWLGAPVWLQLLHLLIANVIWVVYVWLAAVVLSSNFSRSAGEAVGLRQTIPEHR